MSHKEDKSPSVSPRSIKRTLQRVYSHGSPRISPRGSPESSPTRVSTRIQLDDNAVTQAIPHSPALISASQKHRRNSSSLPTIDTKSKSDVYAAMEQLKRQSTRLEEVTRRNEMPPPHVNPLWCDNIGTGHAMAIPHYMMDDPYREERVNDDSEDYDAMYCGGCILWYYNKFILTTENPTED